MATVQEQTPARQRPPVRQETQFIDAQIRRTTRAIKMVDMATGTITLVIGILAYLLAAALLDHWVVPGGMGPVMRTTLWVVLAVGVAWYCWRTFVPLLRPISSVYAAYTIEKGSTSLKNSLLNLLLLRDSSRRLSEKVYQAIEQQAAQRLSQSPVDAVVDRSAVLRVGYILTAIVAACALYAVLSPKDLAISAGRVLAPWSDLPAPTRVQVTEVTPGDASVARGQPVSVSAEVLGVDEDEPVMLRYSSVDGQLKDATAPMRRAGDGLRYELQLPPPGNRGGDIGVQQDLEYWIEAGDARTRRFDLTVFDRPTIVVQRIRYEYPAYTGMRSNVTESTGDIRAVEGTKVTIQALANQPIQSASVDFDADGRSDLPMRTDGDDAVVSFQLELRGDRRTPKNRAYVLRFVTEGGRQNSDPAKYMIDVTPDYAPEVRVTSPAEPETALRVDQTLPITIEARDPDFALSRVELSGRTARGEIEIGELLSETSAERFNGTHVFTPRDHKLQPGDVVEYWAQALDNRQPEANTSFSERRRIRILGRAETPRNDRQRPQDRQGGEGDETEDRQSGEGGQGGGGMQGGEGGESSENADDQASGEGAGESSDSPSEDQQSGSGGAEGDQQGEPSESQNHGDSGSNGQDGGGQRDGDENQQQDEPNNQQQGEPRGQQTGEQRPSDQSQPGQEAQESEKVSPDGDDDAQAFQRIREHFNQQEDGESPQQSGEGGTTAEQQSRDAQNQEGEGSADAANRNRSGEATSRDDATQSIRQDPAGQQQPNDASDAADAQSSDAGDSQDVQGEQTAEPAEESSDRDRPPGRDQQVPGRESEQQPGGQQSPEGTESAADRSQGEPGAGSTNAPDEGSPNPESPDAPSDKSSSEGNERRQFEGTQPPSPSQSNRESDSRGDQQGDQSGGGGRGGGQAANEQGRGASGDSQAADEGAGAADQQGEGETGPSAGGDRLADRETGRSSETESGEGSRSREGQARRPGSEPDDEGASPEADARRNEPNGQQRATDGQTSSSESPQDDSSQQPAAQDDSDSQQRGTRGGAQGPPAGGGSASGSFSSPSSAGEAMPGDDPNLEYADEQTNLLLNKLSDQLAKEKIDRGLLDKLGWNKNDLQRFIERWRNLKARAANESDDGEAQRELAEALSALGLRRDREQQFRVEGQADHLRDLRSGVQAPPPMQYQDSVRAYSRGISAGAGQADDD